MQATMLVWERGAVGEREPNIVVVECDHLEKRARPLECSEIDAHKRGPQWGRLVGGWLRRLKVLPPIAAGNQWLF